MLEFSSGFVGFCSNKFLSDCVVRIENSEFLAHRLVLAAYSGYFFKFFQTNPEVTIAFPEYLKPTNCKTSLIDLFPHVLKFLYSNMDLEIITKILNPDNAFLLLSVSSTLEIKTLATMTEDYISTYILDLYNAIDILNEAVLFQNHQIITASLIKVAKNFESLLNIPENKEKLLKVNITLLKDIISSSDLSVQCENDVLVFCYNYIESYEKYHNQQITSESLLELMNCIRWAYLTHSELLKAASNPLISISKDLILQGLSLQLSVHEQTGPPVACAPRPAYKINPLRSSREKVLSKSSSRFQTLSAVQFPYPLSKASSVKAFVTQDFVYKYDFDDNGLLYYLGTQGKATKWQNPHKLNEVRVFCSSAEFGKIEDFVGRSGNSLRTANEEGSYIGIDIGLDRLFSPDCYTLRASNNISHVCLNWVLEASVNRAKWKVIDKRVHYTGNYEYDSSVETERNALIKRSGTSTWAVGEKSQGFRYFRIRMINKNLSGSFNLALSCIEMYGSIVSGKWP
jgi:BTB/POZ domain/BTB And C-terminal Kelch